MKNTCGACGMVFSGLSGFDEHRTGNYVDIGPDYGRRCRSAVEMAERGYVEREGVWKKPMDERRLEQLRTMRHG
jgi:hypothetical protein